MFGVSQKGASKWLEGLSFPDTKRIAAIAARLQVNVEWLMAGKEPISAMTESAKIG